MRGHRFGLISVAAGVLLLGITQLPTVQARGKAAFALAEAVGTAAPRPWAPDVRRHTATVAGVTVDLYTPGRSAPVIVLLPGAAPAGRADPRVRRLAVALAKADRVVAVPQLDIFRGEFTETDLDRLARLVPAIARHPAVSDEAVVLLGFSFGGSFALLTAANHQARSDLGLVVTFGAYTDFTGLIQAASTGVSIVGNHRLEWTPPPEAKAALERLASALVPTDERSMIEAVLAGEANPSRLSAAARTVLDLVTNTDPELTSSIVDRLPAEARARLARFSPAAVASQISVPVVAIHARDDPVVPWAEMLRLRTTIPAARTATVESFSHVDLAGDSLLATLPDLYRVWACVATMFGVQESWFD